MQDGTRIKLQLWDTAGQERFRSITKSYYRNSVGALLVYDVCNRSSFEHIPLWMMEAKRHIEPHRPVFALVGCKVDLVGTDNKNGARREVTCEEARMFAEENGELFNCFTICFLFSCQYVIYHCFNVGQYSYVLLFLSQNIILLTGVNGYLHN